MKQLNLQSELHFDFRIAKLSTLPLLVQSVVLPGIFTEAPQTGTQFSPIKHVGDTVFFQDLIVTLKVDEGMEAWFEIYKWITGIARSESFQQFKDLIDNKTLTLDGSKPLFNVREASSAGKGYKHTKSTASLMISDANHIKYMDFVFSNIHPINMSGLNFRTDETQTGYMTYDVSFAYDYYVPRPTS